MNDINKHEINNTNLNYSPNRFNNSNILKNTNFINIPIKKDILNTSTGAEFNKTGNLINNQNGNSINNNEKIKFLNSKLITQNKNSVALIIGKI